MMRNFRLAFLSVIMLSVLGGAAHADTVAPTDKTAAGELVFWNSIKKSASAADFSIYLETFPDGMFIDVAKARYQELGGNGEVVAPNVEEAVVADPEPVVVVAKKAAIYKKATVVYVAEPKKRRVAVFAKNKRAKQILAYTKTRVRIKRPTIVYVNQPAKYVAKIKPVKVKRAPYVKVYVPVTTYRKKKAYAAPSYKPATDTSGVGGGYGSGSSGGGGGGAGGGSGAGGGGWGG
jgi:uncharacterized membrane protein YgcG